MATQGSLELAPARRSARGGSLTIRSTPSSITAPGAPAHVQLGAAAAAPEREQLADALAGLRHVGAGGLLGEAHHHQPRERRRQLRQPRERDRVAPPPSSRVDEPVEQLGLLAQQLARCAARWPRPPGAPRAAPARSPWRTRARAKRSSSLLASSRQASPRARAVRGGLLAA